jgi:hypothetical protein
MAAQLAQIGVEALDFDAIGEDRTGLIGLADTALRLAKALSTPPSFG